MIARDFLADQKVLRRPDAPEAPAVSVILPTFQRCAGGLLRRALDSVLTQTFADLELIVVDDGSVDGTSELLRLLQREDPRIVVVRHELNCGLPALRVNEGIELARGRWIAFQFDDDEWLAGALAALVEAAAAAAEPSLVFGRAAWLADSWRTDLPRRPVSFSGLTSHNDIANNSVLVPRVLLERRGLYDPHVAMRRLCDWDLWLRLLSHAPAVAVDRLVSRVPFVSDPTAIGVTAPVDLPVVRYLISIRRDEVLSLGRWRDYPVDAVRVAGIDLPESLAERLEREQLGPYRARFDRLPAAAVPHPRGADSPRVLVCTGDEYDRALDLRVGDYDGLDGRGAAYRKVFHHLWELDLPERSRVAVDLLLAIRTSSPTATGILAAMAGEGTPTAYYLDDDLIGILDRGPGFTHRAEDDPVRVETGRQLALVDAVWTTSAAAGEAVRALNPRLVPHRHAVPESWLPTALPPRGCAGRLRVGCIAPSERYRESGPLWSAVHALAGRWRERLEFEFWGLEVDEPPPAPVATRPLPASLPRMIQRLRRRPWDLLLAPLGGRTPADPAEAPVEYSLAAVAGAVAIFSDLAPRSAVQPGVTCLVAGDTPAGWEAAVEEALALPVERFDGIRRAMIEQVRREHTPQARLHLHEAACRATALHAATRRHRVDGRARILYVLAGGPEPSRHRALLDAAEAVRRYGFAPHALCSTAAAELQAHLTACGIPWSAAAGELLDLASPGAVEATLRSALASVPPVCAHASIAVPALLAACSSLRIPLVVTPTDRWAHRGPHAGRLAAEVLALYADRLRGADREPVGQGGTAPAPGSGSFPRSELG